MVMSPGVLCQQKFRSPKIVKSSDVTVPQVANAFEGYILDKFFNESPETRPTFYFPENRCGPDIIFFVEFKKVTVPVFVQVKLYYGVKNLAQALSMIHPHMFYKNKNEVVYDEKSNKSIIDKIIEKCKVGSIGLLVAYLADIFQESYVTNDHTHYLKNRSSTKQLIRIIDYKNASTVFQEAHLQFLDKLKRTAKRNREEEASEEASKEAEFGTLMDHVQKAEDFAPIAHMLTWTSDHYIGVKKNIVPLQKTLFLPE
ncbi:hypothetical protein RhiirA5_382694 [Rhizophagus irregularis]|uniref:Uncharacterized protein n=1 Tax=Rhizophagus irregularis TaxID=588596 RepID=A0A2N0NZW1_9GLOM|nr:hypothetical protein RhiirA5_382694 [Rhizophagus irregularis]